MKAKLAALVVAMAVCVSGATAKPLVTGPVRGLHPVLMKNLRKLAITYGPVTITPHGGCRKRGSRRAPKSYHRIAAGCKAADVIISGVSGRKILRWWARHVGGGRGYYVGRRFVHVDIGPNRTWTWYFDRKPHRVVRKKRCRAKVHKASAPAAKSNYKSTSRRLRK